MSWLSACDGRVGISLRYLWMAPGLWKGGRETERGRDGPAGTLSLLSDVTPVQVCSIWRGIADSFQTPESRCQPGCGLVWESNLGRIEHVTCDNIHPAWEPEDHIDNVRFIRPRRGSNYEQPCSARAEIGQRLFFPSSLLEWFNSCFSCLYFALRFNVIHPQVVCFASPVCFLLNKQSCPLDQYGFVCIASTISHQASPWSSQPS